MAELQNSVYYTFCLSLVLIIVGIVYAKELLYYIGFMILCGLTGWVMRGDSK